MNIGRIIYENIEAATDSPSRARRILGGASGFLLVDLGMLIANFEMSNTEPKQIAYGIGTVLCFGGSMASIDGYRYGRSVLQDSQQELPQTTMLEIAAADVPAAIDSLDV